MNVRIKDLIEQSITKEEYFPAGCNGYPSYRTYISQEKFAKLIVNDLCEWIDGVPTSEEGMILLTKSFIIANLKGRYNVLS